MCGITGYWDNANGGEAALMRRTVTRMTQAMHRRGPDASGVWIHPREGLALGHTRLSIRDLSPAGHQPMTTSSGDYVLTYNGEVYNSEELRAELFKERAIAFRGTSDTEVILQACAAWGVERAVRKMIGMFAFAFWDNHERKLYLVRDRLGIKPLYWGQFGKLFIFGSELKAFLQHPGWKDEINRDAAAELMRCCFIPAPLSIYKGVYKLRPGHMLQVTSDGNVQDTAYWDARDVMRRGTVDRFTGTDEECITELETLLKDAVKKRMVADVPLGAFLSGGIDSSLVAALMQAQSSIPVKTFSIGFEEPEYNEAPYAKAVAAHLGTRHTEEIMMPRQAWDIIPQMGEFYDEPFADSSQLPTYLLSAITRKHVTVALSGDGGDELFAGYERYFNFSARFPAGDVPSWKKKLVKTLAPVLPAQSWDRLVRLLPPRFRPVNFGMRLHGFAKRASMTSSALYREIGLGHWPDPEALVIGSHQRPSIFDDIALERELADPIERMQFLDSVCYLPDDILVKVDRASMAHSLEARVPLIDHRVYEFSWRLPASMKVRDGKSKWILRQILGKYVPSALFERPKMGFGVPIDHWLRGSLRGWAEEMLDPVQMRQEGYLNPLPIQEIWKKHLEGPLSYHYWLWDVLMFQSWLRGRGASRNSDHLSQPQREVPCRIHE